MEDKYHLTKEQNIFVAKRNIVDYIWKSANLEGIAITYPDTQTIYDGFSVSGKSIEEINAINNLKKAWQFILDYEQQEINYEFISRVNDFVLNISNDLRSPTVERIIDNELKEIFKSNVESKTKLAIEVMLWILRKEFFKVGNKRTAMLVANKIMIENGCGIISIPIEHQSEFYKLLIEYYETNNKDKLAKFIYDCAIDGMDF